MFSDGTDSAKVRGLAGGLPRAAADIWVVIGTVLVAAAVWMGVARLAFDWQSALLPSFACLFLVAGSAFYRRVRPDARLAAAMTATAQIVSFSAVAGLLSYAVARTAGPPWDDTFLSWDRAFGLDWRAYLAFVETHPPLGFAFTLAYNSLLPQMFVVVLVTTFAGRFLACREFIFAVMLAALTSIIFSGLTPAVAMFVQPDLKLSVDFPDFRPNVQFVYALQELHAGTLRVVSLRDLEGVITFPSFHAALGVIFARALWSWPWTRWPGLVLNVLMIAATPIEGGHYFVDVAAGFVVALLAIGAARRICAVAPTELESNSVAGAMARPSQASVG